jgi:hypothetical protein
LIYFILIWINENEVNQSLCPFHHLKSQDEHYESRKRSYTTSYAIVYGVTYDRIRSYFVVLLDARITTVSRRVVYNHRIRPPYTTVHCRIQHRLPSYSYKFLVSEGGHLPITPYPLFILRPFLLLSSSPPLTSLFLISNVQKYLPLLVPMR